MIPRLALSVALMSGCIWCLALTTQADSAQALIDDTFKPVASVESLMHGQKTYFKRITKQLAKPASDKRNHQIAESGEILAELANVNRHNNIKPDYQAWATDLRDTSMALAREAMKKGDADDAVLAKLYLKMKSTCGACHDVYQ